MMDAVFILDLPAGALSARFSMPRVFWLKSLSLLSGIGAGIILLTRGRGFG